MSPFHIKIFAAILILISTPLFAAAQSGYNSSDFPRVEIADTEVRELHSEIIGDTFKIDIFLPQSYGS